LDNLAGGVRDVDFAGTDYKQDTACTVLFIRKIKVFFVHKIHSAAARIIVEFAIGVKFPGVAEPAVGVVV